MKKLAFLFLLIASQSLASFGVEGRLNVTYGTPTIPGTGNPAGVCPGEVCADGDVLTWDDAAQCFLCDAPAGVGPWEDCTGNAIEAVGPVYVGEGSVSGCDGCASAAAGDLVVRGGELRMTATTNLIAPCTADAADNATVTVAGGGAALATRGAWCTWNGNERGGSGGDMVCDTGSVNGAGIVLEATPTDTAGGIALLLDSVSNNDASLNLFNAGFYFDGTTGGAVEVFFDEDIQLRFEGDVADAFEAGFGPATGLAQDTLLLTPPTNGAAGEVLGNTDGAGATRWVARPTSVTLSEHALVCAACPAGVTELTASGVVPLTRTRFDTTGYANIRAMLVLTADTTTADLILQCDTDSAFGSPTDMIQVDNPTRNVLVTSAFTALSGECAGADVYMRAVTKNGNGVESPAFEKIEAQFK